MVGQFISEGMAKAMAEVLRCVKRKTATPLLEPQSNTSSFAQLHGAAEDEEVPYIPIKEINLDDNGLKDCSFAAILNALAT